MLYLHGIGHFHPENQIDNRLGTSGSGIMYPWLVSKPRIGRRTR